MTDEKRNDNQSLVDRLIATLLDSPWSKMLKQAYNLIRKVMPGQSRGAHKVLNYESTLELKDRGGRQPPFTNERGYAIYRTAFSLARTRPGATGRFCWITSAAQGSQWTDAAPVTRPMSWSHGAR
jgi:hypothetical protein